MDTSEASKEIIDLIRSQLGLPPEAEKNVERIDRYHTLSIDLPLRPDLVFQDGGQLYVVEVKRSPVTIDTIARMQLLRQLLQKKTGTHIQLVLAAKTINSREEDLARELGIRFIKLPWTITTPKGTDYTSTKNRITSTKSWKVVSRLLKEKSTSIRQLALKENVSYGWAHKIIEILGEQNVVKKEEGYVTIADVNNLLNGIAWERPLKNLQVDEIPLRFTNSHGAAQEITRNLNGEDIPFAFNSYTAGGLYTGYAFRQDAVSLYLEKKQIDQFREQFGIKNSSGVRAVLYAPDRDVFSDTRELESIMVTSPSQTLLDLAGLGYSAMDLTKVMAEKYASL
jgi:predicted RecB family endonuclease